MIRILRGASLGTRKLLWPAHRCYSSRTSYQIFKENSLQSLVQDLSNSIQDVPTHDNINLREVMNLLRFYQSDKSHWEQYALRQPDTNYTRNLVTKIQQHSNLLVLVWEPGKASKIHSHPGTHCFMKVLQGQLQEHLYEPQMIEEGENILKRSTTLPKDSVAYINDSIGLHRMKNPTMDLAISLHLYVPQFGKNGEQMKSIKNQSEGLGFYSIDGEVVQK